MAMIDAKSPRNVRIIGGKQTDRSAVTTIVYGGGGVAREVAQLIVDTAATGTRIACAGFLVDEAFRRSDFLSGLPVFSNSDRLRSDEQITLVVAIGSPVVRRRVARCIEPEFGARLVTLLHPRATVGASVSLERGAIACAGAVATTDVVIGAHVQLHVNCTIGHDVTIGDFATIAPGANVGGAANIGEGAFVGSGAVVLPRMTIGRWSIVGAGAVVTSDVPDNSTVVGMPAKIVAQRGDGWHLGSDDREMERWYTGRRR